MVVPPLPPACNALLTRTLTPATLAVRVVLADTHRPLGLPLYLPVFLDLSTPAHPALTITTVVPPLPPAHNALLTSTLPPAPRSVRVV
jgi:hypothetical protein